MKTTSILTLTGAVAVLLLTVARFTNDTYYLDVKETPKKLVVFETLGDQDIFLDLASAKADAQDQLPAEVVAPFIHTSGEPCDPEISKNAAEFCLDEIVFIENDENEFELGFDVDTYLPADFNPYARANKELDLGTIEFIEEDEFEGLDFNTDEFLPIGFNAHAGMEPNLDEIHFIEEEEPVILGFDTRKYLPEGFNAYARPELKLDEITYLENEEAMELGFDVNEWLPADFDPYAAPEFDLDQIIFIEEEEEIDLWKDNELPSSEAVYNF